MSQSNLTSEQRISLDHFAFLRGRQWKEALRQCWESGVYSTSDCQHVLQQLRNAAYFGPAGLLRYRADWTAA